MIRRPPTPPPSPPTPLPRPPPDCAPGSYVPMSLVFSPASGDGSFDCHFTDDNPTGTASDPATISIAVTDDDTGSDTGSLDITVHNVAPSVALSGALNVDEGSTHTYSFDTTDPGTADTLTHGSAHRRTPRS